MLELETRSQNKQKIQKHTYRQVGTQTTILAATLQRKVKPKIEIEITRQQLYELAKLYKDSFTEKPGWLRSRFTLDQRRKKNLNLMLYESGLDNSWCGNCCDMTEWCGMLHVFWHSINEKPLCK